MNDEGEGSNETASYARCTVPVATVGWRDHVGQMTKVELTFHIYASGSSLNGGQLQTRLNYNTIMIQGIAGLRSCFSAQYFVICASLFKTCGLSCGEVEKAGISPTPTRTVGVLSGRVRAYVL